MPAVKPVRLLEKVPTPFPSDVLLLAVVGLVVVLQHTPRAVTEAPPSQVILPPLVAVFWVIPVTVVDVMHGSVIAAVVKLSSFPYDIPAVLIAYALK